MIDIEKLRQVMRDIANEKGEFTLFGLFLREEAPDKWDLVVSAPWLEEGKLKALGQFVEKLSSSVGKEELLSLSRIAAINHDDPVLDAILKVVSVENGPVLVRNSNFFGLEIREAHILRAKRPQDTNVIPAT